MEGGSLQADTEEVARIAGTVRMLAVPATLLFILCTLYGLRLVLGVLDIVPRYEVTGTVVRNGSRKYGDALPRYAQELVFRRGRDNFGHRNDDNRRFRHQIALETDEGLKTSTVNPSGSGLFASRRRPRG